MIYNIVVSQAYLFISTGIVKIWALVHPCRNKNPRQLCINILMAAEKVVNLLHQSVIGIINESIYCMAWTARAVDIGPVGANNWAVYHRELGQEMRGENPSKAYEAIVDNNLIIILNG